MHSSATENPVIPLSPYFFSFSWQYSQFLRLLSYIADHDCHLLLNHGCFSQATQRKGPHSVFIVLRDESDWLIWIQWPPLVNKLWPEAGWYLRNRKLGWLNTCYPHLCSGANYSSHCMELLGGLNEIIYVKCLSTEPGSSKAPNKQ